MDPRTCAQRWAVASLLLLLAGCPSPPEELGDAGAPAAPVAHLEKTAGKVTLERGGQASPAVLGYLYLGDALTTAPDGAALIRFGGGRLVEVGPSARFVLSEKGGGVVLEVSSGLVLTRVPGAGGEGAASGAASSIPVVDLSIVTPFGITRVGSPQNAVSVNVDEKGAQVEVLAGAVELVSRNGKSTQAAAGVKAVLGLEEVSLTGRGGVVELSPMPVQILSASGRAEVKRKDSKRWQLLGKGGGPLNPGDSVRGREGRTTLRPVDGKLQLHLPKASELTLVDSGKAAGVEDATVSLGKGALELELPAGQTSRVTVDGLVLESDLGGRFTVVKTADGVEVSALTGDLRAKAGEREATVRAGERATVSRGGAPKIAPVDRPELVLPPKQGLRVFHPGVPLALLTWEGPAADYQLEVGSDAQLTQRVLSGVVHDHVALVPVPARGALYWRVTSADGKTEVAKGSAVFAPEPPQRDLARLRNEVQDGSDKTTIFFQDKPPAVTFLYKPEPGAAQYRLRLFEPGALGTPLLERVGKGEKIPLDAGALAEGSYLWSVTPLSAAGEELRGGRMNKLEITYDNSVPSIVIKTPHNGDVVRGTTLAVAGVAPLGTKVFANGRPLPLDAKHRFEGQASPVGRPPLIIFRTARANGSEVITVRTLRRAR